MMQIPGAGKKPGIPDSRVMPGVMFEIRVRKVRRYQEPA